MEYSPKYVGGKYSIYQNEKIESLNGSPDYVGLDYTMTDCNLKSLKFISKHIGGDLYLFGNKLKSTKYIPSEFSGHIDLSYNKLPHIIKSNNDSSNILT